MSLVSNAILYWNTIKISDIVEKLRRQGEDIDDETLSHISLLPFKHVLPNGTYFINMVTEEGGVEAARRLLHKHDLSDGFVTLYENNRLDLSIEAHVIKPEYRPLFTAEEIAIAGQRLRDVDYVIEA